jgi:hypothetical protein
MMKINVINVVDVHFDLTVDMDTEVYDDVAITTIGPPNLADYVWLANYFNPAHNHFQNLAHFWPTKFHPLFSPFSNFDPFSKFSPFFAY